MRYSARPRRADDKCFYKVPCILQEGIYLGESRLAGRQANWLTVRSNLHVTELKLYDFSAISLVFFLLSFPFDLSQPDEAASISRSSSHLLR